LVVLGHESKRFTPQNRPSVADLGHFVEQKLLGGILDSELWHDLYLFISKLL
jgi:hypothetical protein